MGNIYGYTGGNYAGNVYDKSFYCPTLTNMQGGGRQPMIIESVKAFKMVRTEEGKYLFKKTMKLAKPIFVFRIRKLTPKECYRLMGFSDNAFEKAKSAGNSSTQLYKQAGNSIVVDVLYYIFKELYKSMPYLFDDLKVGSYFSGIGAFEIGLDRLYADINNENFI